MKRVLIDLTDLELWNGHHGGTQRVVYGIAKNFFAEKDSQEYDVVFIAFSAQNRRFYETSFEPIYKRVEDQKTDNASQDHPRTQPLKTRLKQNIRPYVPESVRKSHTARMAATKSIEVARRTAGFAKRSLVRNRFAPTGQAIEFKKDDVVLVLGKPWDNLDIQRTLTAEKTKAGFKLVQVVYDLIIPFHPNLHHPSLFTSYTQHMFEAVTASDLMLPISKSSGNDLKKFCQILELPVPAMKVVRLGDEIIETIDGVKPDQRIENEFIACIGTVEIRKNHTLLYYAYKLGIERGIKLPQLVIVGGQGWLTGDFQYLVQNDPELNDKIIILNNVNDSGLSWIYENCKFTVYPSMYEGWGLPVAESLARGKLCIASKASSIPEIAGSLAEYFSPYNPEECLSVVSTYLNPNILKEKEEAIVAKYKMTSWHQTFQEVNESLLKLIS